MADGLVREEEEPAIYTHLKKYSRLKIPKLNHRVVFPPGSCLHVDIQL
jgi:hypothetical protein